MSTKNLVVLDVVGLTSRLLAHMPRLSALAARGFRAELQTTFPAVTCSVPASPAASSPAAAQRGDRGLHFT